MLLTGCTFFQKKGVINSGGATVTAVDMAGKPATLVTLDAKESLPIPKDTTVTITEHAATPTVPAYKVTELHFNSPTEWLKFNTTVAANTGTVDTSVAVKKIEAQAAQPLLYAAILSALAGVFFLYRAYPTPAALCGLSAAGFLIAWRTSNLPSWAWGLLGLGLVGGVALYLGHSRGVNESLSAPKPPAVS